MYGASALAGAALAGSELPDAKNAKVRETEATADDEWENLLREAGSLGKPAWMHAVEQYYEMTGSKAFLEPFYRAVVQQISWFEKHRKADGEGYYYTDILTHQWESGVDEGIRFREVKTGKSACVDATSHVYQMYDLTAKWAEIVGQDLSAEPNRTATCVTHQSVSTMTATVPQTKPCARADNPLMARQGRWGGECTHISSAHRSLIARPLRVTAAGGAR